MKLNKTMFIVCIAAIGIFAAVQLSYAYTAMVNLGAQTDGPAVGAKVDKAVRDAAATETLTTPGEGTLSSNTSVTTKSLASGETLIQVRPDLAEDMNKLLTIPAQSIITETTLDVAVAMINEAITNGKDVGIMGLNDEELGKAAAALEGKVANLADLREKRILFLIFNNDIIQAVQQQFNQSNGDYVKATANLLSPAVQEAIKGGV